MVLVKAGSFRMGDERGDLWDGCRPVHTGDSLIWATARLNQVGLVFSEDFPHEQIVEGVRFINPFFTE
jgi:hypothetical protein